MGRYTQSSEPRVRHAAFLTLKSACESPSISVGTRLSLDPSFYRRACRALSDDFEGVRSAALEIVFILAQEYPEEKVWSFQSVLCMYASL